MSKPRRIAIAVASAMLGVLIIPSIALAAGKKVDRFFPATTGAGGLGGQFDRPTGMALNEATGRLYVADSGNHRIQRFHVDDNGTPADTSDDSEGFEIAFGRDVVAPGGTGNLPQSERQTVTVDATGGTFTLRFRAPGLNQTSVEQTTAPIAFDATAAAVQGALEALASVEPGDILVTGAAGGPWTIDFAGAYADADIEPISVGNNGNQLTGGSASVSFATTIPGAPFFEICTAASECKAGEPGTVGGAMNNPQGIAIEPDSGELYVRDMGNGRVQRFDADGNFISAWGADVVQPGGSGETPRVNEEQLIVLNDVQFNNEPPTGGTFTLSPSTATGRGTLVEGSSQVTDVSTEFGAFSVGDEITALGGGIPDGTTITAVGAGTLTLSANATEDEEGGRLAASQTTAPIAHDATATQLEGAIESLPGFAPVDVAVSAAFRTGSWFVEFAGAYAAVDVPLMGFEDEQLEGGFPKASVRTTAVFDGNFEVCTVAAECQAGTSAPNAGGFRGTSSIDSFDALPDGAGIAISPLNDHLFLADPGNERVQEFGADGSFLRAWGWGVDDGDAALQICTAASTCTSAHPINYGESFRAPVPNGEFIDAPTDVAVDFEGTVYANGCQGFTCDDGEGEGEGELRFDSTVPGDDQAAAAALLLPKLEPESKGGMLPNGVTHAMAVSSGGTSLYLARSHAGFVRTSLIYELDLTTEPPTLSPDIHYEDSGLVAHDLLATATGNLYLSSISGQDVFTPDHRVYVADADGAGTPNATIEDPPSNITANSADLAGTVNPEAFPNSTAQFQLSTDGGATWSGVGAPQPLPEVDASVEVSATATELESGVTYQARLAVTKGYGAGTGFSETISFTTIVAAPTVVTLRPRDSGPDHATVAGTVNPNGRQTSYRFEYVTDAQFQADGFANASTAPVPDGDAGEGSSPLEVVQRLAGLDPLTTYHYRLAATNEEGTDFGATLTFQTPGTSFRIPQGRAYEMVTPPFKATRSVVAVGFPPHENASPGQPSIDGNSIHWASSFFPLTDDVRAPGSGDMRIIRRTSDGWVNSTLNTLKILPTESQVAVQFHRFANSGDLETVAWRNYAGGLGSFLPHEGESTQPLYTRRDGTGVAGFTPWLRNPDVQVIGEGFAHDASGNDSAVINDDGTAMVRWARYYRGLAEDPDTTASEDPSDDQQLDGDAGGAAPYLQRAADPDQMPSAPKDLVSECTGSLAGGDATLIPARDDNGTPGDPADDTIASRPCEAGNVTSVRGATVGGGGISGRGPSATALTDDGNRVFFMSPDPGGSGSPIACAKGTGPATDCPPQLFVRQYAMDGEPTVRWISRAQGVGEQQIDLLGKGAAFQGASRDGRYVYFSTNAPLLPGDPNGGSSITTGAAFDQSWDIYRYELPELGVDPADGTLERISRGPAGNADPNTPGANSQDGASVRYLSDDGDRAYFLTRGPIAGADATPPQGGVTTPGGTAADDGGQRNIYLYDETDGSPSWTFVARVPTDDCTTKGVATGLQVTRGAGRSLSSNNCWRGTRDGESVLFATDSQLVAADTDAAHDIYLYQAGADTLVRVTAPSPGVEPYACGSGEMCNGDMGEPASQFSGLRRGAESTRGWAGNRYLNVSREADGEVSVFFQTKLQLIPADTNGRRWDVYQWKQGELALISPGNTEDDSFLSGNSVSGRDVFIFTSARIDPRELDDHDYDIYDARIGGGFPYTPPPVPCNVLALECEMAAAPAPPAPSAATPDFNGVGNVAPKQAKRRCAKGKLRRGNRCLTRRQIARRACRKVDGRKAKRRCMRKQVARLNRLARARRICRSKQGGKVRRRCVRKQARRLERKQQQRAQRKKRANRRQGGRR